MTPLPGQELQYIFLNQHRLTLERLRDNDSPWKPPAGVNARPSLPSLPRSGAASLSAPWEDLLILIQGQERGVLPGEAPRGLAKAIGQTAFRRVTCDSSVSLKLQEQSTVLRGSTSKLFFKFYELLSNNAVDSTHTTPSVAGTGNHL